MRLLHSCEGEFQLTKDLDGDIPKYAILSHTWGPDKEEVTFQDLVDGTGRRKIGFDKIEFCATQAKIDGLQYFWIDTCCIDKSNQAELSKAVDSMFRWYQNAAICYVYLSDVLTDARGDDNQHSEPMWEAAFRASRWFTRGWTLQELLAPPSVEFFTRDGQRLGDKRSLEEHIHRITGIAIPALRGNGLAQFSIKERFRWAETRDTKRGEDWAYCLQGIFGVSMPLMYGEGKALAVSRLEKEIKKNQECLEELRTTDPRDDKQRIEQTKGGLSLDCYRWILGNADFQRWQTGQNQLLWVRGDPGKGKTMLLCGVINDLEKLPGRSLSYFFCQATDSRINNATAVLRGLIYLLINQQPLLITHIREKYDESGKQLFEDANAWVALSAIFNNLLQDPNLVTTYLVIDALDECVMGLEVLLGLIIQTSMANCRVKWIVSSRNWPNIEKVFTSTAHDSSLSLELNEVSVSKAVATYIELKTESLAKENDYDRSTRETVRRHLIQNAGGTFLWVALVCQELATMSSWEVNEESIAMFPPGLDELYKRMMSQIRDSRHSQLCKSILATLSIVYRPITLDELPCLVEIPPKAVGNDKALADIIGICGSFLSLRDRKIFFTHQSVNDFLLDQETKDIFPSGEIIEHQNILRRSIKAMSQVLRKDIYSLQHPGIFIEEVERQRPMPDPLAPIGYACVHWVNHLCQTGPAYDHAAILAFLKTHFLHWFEALSILRMASHGLAVVSEYMALLIDARSDVSNVALAKDMWQFAESSIDIIEQAPLQVYSSALAFSPNNSLTRKLFEGEGPDWIIRKPRVEDDWHQHSMAFEGHSDLVTCMVFSGDGRRVASGSVDKTVKIWSAESGICTMTLSGHKKLVTCVVLSADGWLVASGSDDQTVRIWNTQKGHSSITLEGHSKSITCVVFSTDCRRVASGSHDKTVKIWDTESGECMSTLKGHDISVASVSFSLDNRHIASGSFDRTIKIWDAQSFDCTITLKGHSGWVSCVVFSADSRLVASGSGDKTVKIWDTKSGACMISCDTDVGVITIIDEFTTAISPATTTLRLQDTRHLGYSARSDGSWITWNGQNVLFLAQDSRPRLFEIFQETVFVGCPSGRVWSIKFSSTKSPILRLPH